MKYIIKKSQYEQLLENKRKEATVIKKILENIRRAENSLNEGEMLNEAIVDTIRRYFKKGLLTTAVIASLLANNVQAQQLAQAGVPQQKIEQALNQEQGGEMSPNKIEKKLLNVLKKRGQVGIIKQFNSLDANAKSQLLTVIAKSIKNLSDIDKYEYRITDWLSKEVSNSKYSEIGQQQKIIVDTVTVNIVKDFVGNFAQNSSELQNIDQTREELQKIFNSFDEIRTITIVASSSTLRNTGEAEGKTWKQLATERADILSNIIVGMSYDLGGEGVNPSHTINQAMISIDSDGENGDGTSGPKSPYETNPQTVAYYTEKGIDPSLWKSAATQEPYADKNDYAKHQYVKVVITGNVVEDNTDQIVNYRYLVMSEKKEDIKVYKAKQQDNRIGKKSVIPCPIKIKS